MITIKDKRSQLETIAKLASGGYNERDKYMVSIYKLQVHSKDQAEHWMANSPFIKKNQYGFYR